MNIAEILKHCPKGAKLYSLIHGEVTLDEVNIENNYPITVVTCKNNYEYFTSEGTLRKCYPNSECILFPSKEQRDWSKFRIPVKRGDIMMMPDTNYAFIATGRFTDNESVMFVCGIDADNELCINPGNAGWTKDFYIPASEEAKKKLFDKIEEAGYRWNSKTLELEKVKQNELKPFDKVLVRDDLNEKWSVSIFSYYCEKDKDFPYICLNSNYYHYCIPYKVLKIYINKIKKIKMEKINVKTLKDLIINLEDSKEIQIINSYTNEPKVELIKEITPNNSEYYRIII